MARLFYGILWILTIVAFSIPRYSTGDKSYSGWNFVIPFSMTYLIAIILGFVVLTSKWMAFGLTIAAGVLMIVGVALSVLGGEVGSAIFKLTGDAASSQAGIGFAFVISIIYLIIGSWLGKRMTRSTSKPE